MTGDININEITSNVINQQIKDVRGYVSQSGRQIWLKHILKFDKYLSLSEERYGKTKTLLSKDKDLQLEDIYVDALLAHEGNEYQEEELFEKILNGKNVVTTATAGAGKSFLARHIFLKLVGSKEKVPILVELRYVNDTILKYILDEFEFNGIDINEKECIDFFRSGKFTIILDGYDEVAQANRKSINKEVLSLQKRIGSSNLLITSRPDEELEYMDDFLLYQVKNLNLTQATELVSKLPFDSSIKKGFIDKLNEGTFDTHKDFLSNPLLLTIMLLTFTDVAEIPKKMHIFYEHAFDALFYKHDSSKGLYIRETFSKLIIDDFKDILACVSMSGYRRDESSFSNSKLLNYIGKAKKLLPNIQFNTEAYKKDLLKSVCILVQDGTEFTYTHRSFQEYFSAIFLTKFDTEAHYQLFKDAAYRHSDSPLYLAFEINQSAVERNYVLPLLDEIKNRIGDEPDAKVFFEKMLSKVRFSTFIVGSDAHWSPVREPDEDDDGDLLYQLMVLRRLYELKSKGKVPSLHRVLSKKKLNEFLGKPLKGSKITTRNNDGSTDWAMVEGTGLIDLCDRHLSYISWLEKHLDSRPFSNRKSNILKII